MTPSQLHCPKCRSTLVNCNASDLIANNGLVTCSKCGHERRVMRERATDKHTPEKFAELSLRYHRSMELVMEAKA
jgi:DNA-directed RNA polymerase subunit M/transcription elongation factor TFIIS